MDYLAYAMGSGAGGNAATPQGGAFATFIPLILMFVIFYFLLIRPQQKKARQHREMLNALRVGDNIVTSGGLYGTITGIGDGVVTVEIAPKVRVKISRGSIAAVLGRGQDVGQKG
ncbi:MAG: preprotein translocase subunit YajC [Desulfatiglandales bacterium]